MNEPQRLLEGEGSELERTLLEAGRDEQPNSRGRRQAAVALAAVTGVSAFTKWAWAGTDLLRLGAAHAGKVVAGTVVVGSTTLAVVHATSDATDTTTQGAAQPAAAAASPRSDAPVQREEAKSLQVEDLPAEEEVAEAEPASEKPPGAKNATAAYSIADEIKALDAARQSLNSGNPSRALQLLNEYSRKYRGGRLGQEAMLIRIEALARSGQSAQAKTLARRFRAANPRSPYTKRLESIIGPL